MYKSVLKSPRTISTFFSLLKHSFIWLQYSWQEIILIQGRYYLGKWREEKERKRKKLSVGETRTIEAEGAWHTTLADFPSFSVLAVARHMIAQLGCITQLPLSTGDMCLPVPRQRLSDSEPGFFFFFCFFKG